MIPLYFSCTDDLLLPSIDQVFSFNNMVFFYQQLIIGDGVIWCFTIQSSRSQYPYIFWLDENLQRFICICISVSHCFTGGKRESAVSFERYTKTPFVSSHLSIHDATIYRKGTGKGWTSVRCFALSQYTIATEATFLVGFTGYMRWSFSRYIVLSRIYSLVSESLLGISDGVFCLLLIASRALDRRR